MATVASLQNSLDYLRLLIKYLIFDLEATRRELESQRKDNDSLRQMLGDPFNPPGHPDDDDKQAT